MDVWIIDHPHAVKRPRRRKNAAAVQSTYSQGRKFAHTTIGGAGLVARLRRQTSRRK